MGKEKSKEQASPLIWGAMIWQQLVANLPKQRKLVMTAWIASGQLYAILKHTLQYPEQPASNDSVFRDHWLLGLAWHR